VWFFKVGSGGAKALRLHVLVVSLGCLTGRRKSTGWVACWQATP